MSTVAEAITTELDQLGVADKHPGLAQLAITLATSVDLPGNATAQANAARELRAVMEDLRKLAPVAQDMDRVDELAQKREDGLVRARRA
ncbi:hypothetical protein ACIG92_08295 [[Kitasatospora] papulosa]|jgi:hypothetical protein|uniref:hypothetical protein n=1 Tax=[Kitasatospora] papulosa TaxID=1464011 RepID=UPI0037D65F0F